MSTQADIPVVSLAPWTNGDRDGIERAARAFGDALETIGFVSVVDHGVEIAEVQALYGHAKTFFRRPEQQKLECMLPEVAKPDGYIPRGAESVAATLRGEEAPDLCEALCFAVRDWMDATAAATCGQAITPN